VADGSRPPGSRITSIKIGNAPLEDTKTYRVATNDFMARGGDGYTIFRDARQILPGADAPPLANEVVDYIKQEGTLRTSVEGRLVVRLIATPPL
jgi:2',3'-cyclic-nucleotide 2'-phosphodiesterase (5'-nucleotidase family)